MKLPDRWKTETVAVKEMLKARIDNFRAGIRNALVVPEEPEILARMPEFYERLVAAKEIYELQQLWDDVRQFESEVGYDLNQNLRELEIQIEARISEMGGIKPKY